MCKLKSWSINSGKWKQEVDMKWENPPVAAHCMKQVQELKQGLFHVVNQ